MDAQTTEVTVDDGADASASSPSPSSSPSLPPIEQMNNDSEPAVLELAEDGAPAPSASDVDAAEPQAAADAGAVQADDAAAVSSSPAASISSSEPTPRVAAPEPMPEPDASPSSSSSSPPVASPSSSASAPAASGDEHVDPASFIFSADDDEAASSFRLEQQSGAAEEAAAEGLSLSIDTQTAEEQQGGSGGDEASFSQPPLTPTVAFSPTALRRYTLHSPVSSPLATPTAAAAAAPPADRSAYDGLHRLPPSHPLLQAANAQLEAALREQEAEVSKQVASHARELAALEKQRTELGVSLYGHQQELAKSQLVLEKQIAAFAASSAVRAEKEARLEAMKAAMAERRQADSTAAAQRDSLQREVDELQTTIRQVQAYRAELSDELRVSQSLTGNEEALLQKEERRKAQQDLDILALSEKLQQAEKEAALIALQTDSQRAENERVKAVVEELEAEVRLVQVEAKEYMERWRQAVRQGEVKQEAIGLAEQAVEELREKVRSLRLSILNSEKAARGSQQEHEQLLAFQLRLDSELGYLQSQCSVIDELRAKYTDNHALIVAAISSSEEQLKRHRAACIRLEGEIASSLTAINSLANRRNEMEESRLSRVNEELVLEKDSEALWKRIREDKKAATVIDSQLVEISNEMARTRIDLVNSQQHNAQLAATQANYALEIAKKDALIDGYEAETLRRHELISKKQNDIIRLNKELERFITAAASQLYSETVSDDGPLDIQITNINKKIARLRQGREQQQKDWLRTQKQIVNIAADVQQEETVTAELTAKLSVLRQQSSRLQAETSQAAALEANLQSAMKSARQHGAKMSEWAEEARGKRAVLEDANYVRQQEFMRQLKEKEEETQRRADAIAAVRQRKEEEKAAVLNAEYRIMQMQRRIEVEKETQELLDPTVGQAEIAALRKDNAALELTIAAAKKELERRKQEMERLILQTVRDRNIITPLNSKQALSKERSVLQQQTLAANNSSARKQREKRRLAEVISGLKQEAELVQSELQRQQAVFNSVELQRMQRDAEVEGLSIDVRMLRERLIRLQARGKKFDEKIRAAATTTAVAARASRRNGSSAAADAEAEEESRRKRERVEEETQKAVARYQTLVEEVRQLAEEQPRYRDWIQRLLQWA